VPISAARAISVSTLPRSARCGVTPRSMASNQPGSASNQWKSPLNTIAGGTGSIVASFSMAASAARLP
jgi:hypothetical protein